LIERGVLGVFLIRIEADQIVVEIVFADNVISLRNGARAFSSAWAAFLTDICGATADSSLRVGLSATTATSAPRTAFPRLPFVHRDWFAPVTNVARRRIGRFLRRRCSIVEFIGGSVGGFVNRFGASSARMIITRSLDLGAVPRSHIAATFRYLLCLLLRRAEDLVPQADGYVRGGPFHVRLSCGRQRGRNGALGSFARLVDSRVLRGLRHVWYGSPDRLAGAFLFSS
jgi:hypothetical protein